MKSIERKRKGEWIGMLFNVDEFFEKESRDESVSTTIGETDFRIRPLNGIESLEYDAKESRLDRVLYLLQTGLFSGEGNEPLSESEARSLFARHEVLASELAVRILRLTEDVYAEEERRWGLAKKNSKIPPTNGSGENIAGGTGSTLS